MEQFKDKIKFSLNVKIKDGKKEFIGMPRKWNDLNKSIIKKTHKEIAILTGEKNNITIIDFDKEEGMKYYKQFENIIKDTFIETSFSGYKHAYFEYDKDLKTVINLNNTNIDILNNSKCCIMGKENNNNKITKIPKQFKDFLIYHSSGAETNSETDLDTDSDISFDNESSETNINDNEREDINKINLVLSTLNKNRFNDYDNWIKIGMIIKYYHNNNDGFELFNKYSKLSTKYTNIQEMKKYWDRFNNNENSNQLKFATLMLYSKEDNNDKTYSDLITLVYDKDIDININNNDIDIHYHDYYDIDNNKVWKYYELLNYLKRRIYYFETSQCFYIRKLIIENRLDKKTKQYTTYKYIDYIPVKDVYTDNKTIYFITDDNKIKLNKLVHIIFKQYLSIKDVIFKPYSVKYKAKIHKKELNLYYDINEHTYNKDFKIDMDLVNIALNHIKIVISNNDNKLYEYILNYICFKLQMPFIKTESCLLLHSLEQGTGKTAFYHLLQKLFGPRYVNDSSINELQKSFNSLYSRCLFVILEETEKGLSRNVNDFLKKSITQKTIREEEKFMKPIILDDYREIMILTNNFDTVKLDNNDRRFCCVNVSNIKKNNNEYFNKYYDFIDNPDKMIHLYHYLINKNIDNYDPRKIIITDIKNEMILDHEDGIITFVKYINENIDNGLSDIDGFPINEDSEIKTAELHLMYNKFVKDHLTNYDTKTIIKFSKDIKLYYEKIHKTDTTYFKIKKYKFTVTL